MGNALREQIKDVIMDNVYVTKLRYDDGEFIFTYEGVSKAADLIVSLVHDRLESIDCE